MASQVMQDRGRMITEAELLAIARRAADPPPGRTPEEVIDEALRLAGVEGDYQRSREWRELWHLAASLVVSIWRARRGADPDRSRPVLRYSRTLAHQRLAALTAGDFWRWYSAGESQAKIARRLGLSPHAVGQRSRELGFRLQPRPGRGAIVVIAGPCLGCGAESDSQYCPRCRPTVSVA